MRGDSQCSSAARIAEGTTLDKYEFKLSLNEINALIEERRFDEAAGIADGIDWNHVKSARTLCRVSEVYKIVGDYDKSREVMEIASKREPDNPQIIYALCELTIFLYQRDGAQEDLTKSLQLLKDYQTLAPENPRRLILQYKMYCASPVSSDEKLAVLKQLHEEKPSARWDYELAKLYAESGDTEDARKTARATADQYEGKYADRARNLLAELGSEESDKPASQNAGAEPEQSAPGENTSAAVEKADDGTATGIADTEENVSDSSTDSDGKDEPQRSEESAGDITTYAARVDTGAGNDAAANLHAEAAEETLTAENAVGDGQQRNSAELPGGGIPAQAESSRPETDDSGTGHIPTPEEQHSVDSIQNNVADGMKDILARPYDDKLEQETSGQYTMVMDQPKEADQQVDGQMSISEVMAEWEKIRSDIRRANDEKRAQRILEDTGSILKDFDETARHGLLEDIEKGVARQRRQVRSGAYRVSDALPEDRYVNPDRPERQNSRYGEGTEQYAGDDRPTRRTERYAEDAPQTGRDDYYDEPGAPAGRDGYAGGRRYAEERPYDDDRRPARENSRYPEDNRYREDREDEYYRDDRRERQAARYVDETDRSAQRPRERRGAAPQSDDSYYDDEEDARPIGGESDREEAGSTSPVPVANEDDDVKIYGSNDDINEVETRRWNSEEVHRAMARQEELARRQEMENVRARRDDRSRRRTDKETPEQSREPYPDEGEKPELKEEREGEEEARRKSYPVEQPEETYPADEDNLADEAYPETAEAEEEYPEERETAGQGEEGPDGREPVYQEEEGPDDRGSDYQGEESDSREPADQGEEAPDGERPAYQDVPDNGEQTPQEEPAADQKPEEETAGEYPENREPETEPGKSGSRRELTREERRLFGPFCRMKANTDQLLNALDKVSLASSTGNIIILGNEATADRVAKGILEIQRHSDSNFTGKIAKVSGDSLNKLDTAGFSKTFAKLENGALIINKASDIAPKTLERLYKELEEHEHGIILIMADGYKRMDQFRKENLSYLGSFNAVINIRPLDDKALVAYAKDYAYSQDYSIDEFGQLALAQRISSMQTSSHRVTLKEVRDIVDEAIHYASRKTPHTLMEVISRKRYDENDRIIIHEKDFQHD